MVKLKNNYKKNGYDYSIVWRDDNYAIAECKDTESKRFLCYESFKILITEENDKNKSWGEYPRERVPNNESWGKYGYSVHTLEQAHQKIEFMRQRTINHKNKIKIK